MQSLSSVYGDVIFRLPTDQSKKTLYLSIKGRVTRGDWARVLSWGRETTYGGRGGVIQIDKLLLPYRPTVWLEYGPSLLVGAIGSAFIVGFFMFVRSIWIRNSTEATYEPIGGFEEDD